MAATTKGEEKRRGERNSCIKDYKKAQPRKDERGRRRVGGGAGDKNKGSPYDVMVMAAATTTTEVRKEGGQKGTTASLQLRL